jgi:hypothetical protein
MSAVEVADYSGDVTSGTESPRDYWLSLLLSGSDDLNSVYKVLRDAEQYEPPELSMVRAAGRTKYRFKMYAAIYKDVWYHYLDFEESQQRFEIVRPQGATVSSSDFTSAPNPLKAKVWIPLDADVLHDERVLLLPNPFYRPDLADYLMTEHFKYWILFVESLQNYRTHRVSTQAEIGNNYLKNVMLRDNKNAMSLVAYMKARLPAIDAAISIRAGRLKQIEQRRHQPSGGYVDRFAEKGVSLKRARTEAESSRVLEVEMMKAEIAKTESNGVVVLDEDGAEEPDLLSAVRGQEFETGTESWSRNRRLTDADANLCKRVQRYLNIRKVKHQEKSMKVIAANIVSLAASEGTKIMLSTSTLAKMNKGESAVANPATRNFILKLTAGLQESAIQQEVTCSTTADVEPE